MDQLGSQHRGSICFYESENYRNSALSNVAVKMVALSVRVYHT